MRLAMLVILVWAMTGCACTRLQEPALKLARATRVYVSATRSCPHHDAVKELGEKLVTATAELEEATR